MFCNGRIILIWLANIRHALFVISNFKLTRIKCYRYNKNLKKIYNIFQLGESQLIGGGENNFEITGLKNLSNEKSGCGKGK